MEYVAEKKHKSIFKTYLIYFISLIIFVGIRICSALGFFADMGTNAIDIIYSVLIEVICLFAIPFILYCLFLKVKPKQLFKTCNFSRLNIKTVLLSILTGVLIYFLTIFLSSFFNGIIHLLGYQSSNTTTDKMTLTTYIIQIFTTALLPAFCEEFLHRGILLQGTKHMGFYKSIIISSLLFGLIHLNITQVFYAAVLGFILGYISVVTKNIWPAIIIHFVNNFMSITNTFLTDNVSEYSNFINSIYANFSNFSYILLVLFITSVFIVIVFVIYFLITRLHYNALVRKVENAIEKAYSDTGFAKSNMPINYDDGEIRDLVESTTTLNIDFNSVKNPLDVMMPKQKKIYKTSYKDNIFLKASFVLSIIITIFTFIWGFM